MNTKSSQNRSPLVSATTAEPARTAGAEADVKDTAEIRVVADQAALDSAGESTRDLLPDEAEAWALLASPAEVNRAIAERRDMVIVDVRAAEDFAKGHVPGAVNLPRDQWQAAAGLSKEKVNVVYCYSGTCALGGEACAQLAEQGYPVVEMYGGFDIWDSSAFEIEQ